MRTLPESLKIAQLRRIVDTKQFDKVEGSRCDLFTASAILVVYDGLNDIHKAQYLGLPLHTMASMAWKLIKQSKEGERGE